MIAALLSDLWPYIIAAGAFIAGAFGLYAKIRSGDKAKDDLRDAEETIKSIEVRNEVDNRIARERDARGKLREDWSE